MSEQRKNGVKRKEKTPTGMISFVHHGVVVVDRIIIIVIVAEFEWKWCTFLEQTDVWYKRI